MTKPHNFQLIKATILNLRGEELILLTNMDKGKVILEGEYLVDLLSGLKESIRMLEDLERQEKI